LHIALVSHGYPDKGAAGGIGTATRILAHALSELGHRVTVIAEVEDVGAGRYNDGAVEVIRYEPGIFSYRAAFRILRTLPIPKIRKEKLLQLDYSLQRAASLDRMLVRLVRDEEIDIVEFPEWDFPAFFFARRSPVPVVVKAHSPHFLIEEGMSIPRPRRNYAKLVCERDTLRNADLVIAVADAVGKRVARKYGIPNRRMAHIPYAFRLAGVPTECPDRNSTGVMLQLGRIEPTKGHDITAAAFPDIVKRIPNVSWHILGEPAYHQYTTHSYTDKVRSKIERDGLADKVRFLGVKPHSEVPAILAESDVLLQPSRFENYSLAILEAMYAGTAVVASDVGGSAEVLDNGKAGVLVPSCNPAELAKATVTLLSNDKERERLRRAAWETVRERNNPALIAEEHVKHYTALLRRRRHRA
jgi:glycosyltransferase involved in cell wall biosynthesis